MRLRQPFSGWRIVGLSMLTVALTGPGQTIGVSVFIDWFVLDLDLSRATVSTAYLVGTVGGGITMPRVGRALDRYGVRRGITLIGVLFAGALVFMAGVNGLVALTIGFFGIRLLGQGALSLASSVAVAHWFDRRRGLAIGLTMTGGGALMALIPVGLNAVIEAIGWRSAWLVAAAVVFLTVVPMGWFGFIDRPADIGQQVDGGGTKPDDADVAGPATGLTPAEARHTRGFWIIAAVAGTTSMIITAFNFHQIALLGEAGLSSTAAAAMFLPQVVGTALAGVAMGAAADRFGTRFVPAFGIAMLAISQLLGVAVFSGFSAVPYAFALGATGGAVRTMTGTLLPAWFGTRHLGAIQGSLSFVSVVASAAGPLGLAIAEAAAGGYAEAMLLSSVLTIAVLGFSLTMRSPRLLTPQST